MEFGKACEDLSWNHCTSTPHRLETNGIAERAVRRVKEGTSAVFVAIRSEWKLVGRFYGMFHLSAKRHRSILWWEDALWKTFLGNHSKDRLFHLVHWLSITLFLWKTSQESINFERKSYLDCSVDTRSVRGGEFGRVTKWLQTLRSWKRWTHRKSTRKELNAKEVIFRQTRRIYFSNSRWTNQNSRRRSGTENIHLGTASTNSRRGSHWLSWRIRRVFSTPSWLTSGCRWSYERFLVHVGMLHIPPSRWTTSRTLLAERRIIPCSTEIHWCFQNYSYEFGCQAGEAHRWLLECRWVKRFVWFMDRFHWVYSIGRETSRRIFVVRWQTDKKAVNIQARSFLWPELWIKMRRHAQLKERQKWSHEKAQLDNARKLRGIYVIVFKDKEFKETIKSARKKLENANGSCYALQDEQEQSELGDSW